MGHALDAAMRQATWLAARPQADSRLRPLARRLANTLRPPTVAMRERNPWRRLRTSFDGW